MDNNSSGLRVLEQLAPLPIVLNRPTRRARGRTGVVIGRRKFVVNSTIEKPNFVEWVMQMKDDAKSESGDVLSLEFFFNHSIFYSTPTSQGVLCCLHRDRVATLCTVARSYH